MSSGGVASNWYRARYREPPRNRRPRHTHTSHRFEVRPAFKMPPPLVRWCLRLIVTMPLVTPLPLLVLSTIHRLLSANASPPVGLLFTSWLSCHPCCRAAAASCPLDTPPPPLILSTRCLCLATSRLCLATPCHLLSARASPLVCLSFAGWFIHHISSRRRLKCPSLTPVPSFTPAGCCVSSCCAASAYRPLVNTATS
jgi:hypothetical protein